MAGALGPQKADMVVELGVALGGFSHSLINRYDPERFYAIDTFQLHQLEHLWGGPPSLVFGTRTHADYYATRCAALQIEFFCYKATALTISQPLPIT